MTDDAIRDEIEAALTGLGLNFEASPRSLLWRIYPEREGILEVCYDLQVLPEQDALLIFYDNTDAGAAINLMRRCLHIPIPRPPVDRFFTLERLLEQALCNPRQYPPNTYGLT